LAKRSRFEPKSFTQSRKTTSTSTPFAADSTKYAPGTSTNAHILIYDGPQWSILELAASPSFITYDSAGLAVNAGVVGANGWSTVPQAVGRSIWKTNSSSPALTHGALWTSASVASATDFRLVFRPYGISFRPDTQTANRAKVVGSMGTSASIQLRHRDHNSTPQDGIDFKVALPRWQLSRAPVSGSSLPAFLVDLGWLSRGAGILDPQSEAKAISSYLSLRVVGWSGSTVTDPNRHAVFHTSTEWKDFNDRHFTHGSGWLLVACVGTLSGSPRGFILLPRTTGN